ncbi:MAG: DUF2690 domain-containing protein [Streptomyces sp.]|nr:DUF2690 domain-containing protein [Streptomyces sp.]
MSGPRTELDRLARELVALRKRAGLSLGVLAERTSVSKSAWHRYLSGRNLPPRQAVAELCALTEESPTRLLALWEVAEAEREGGPGPAPVAGERDARTEGGEPSAVPPGGDTEGVAALASEDPEPEAVVSPYRRPWRRVVRRWWPVGASLLLSAAVFTAMPYVRESAAEPTVAPPGCRGAACDGEDPESQGCTTPGTDFGAVAEAAFPGGARMEIRHSAHCGALWARVWLAQDGDRIELRVPGRPTRQAVVRDRHDADGYVYTRMTGGAPEGAEACLLPADGGPERCFTA